MHNLFNNQRLVGLLFLILSGLYVWYIKDIPLDFWSETEPFNARSMPQLYGYAGLIIACPSRGDDAARKGELEEVSALLAEGAKIDAGDGEGKTALYHAAQQGHTATARLLHVQVV